MTNGEKLISTLKRILGIEGPIDTKELILKAIKEFPSESEWEKKMTDFLNGELDSFDGTNIKVCSYAFCKNPYIESAILSNAPDRCFFNSKTIRNVYLTDDVTEIEQYAFGIQFGSVLETVRLPDSLKKIGINAFASNVNLKMDRLPSSLEELGVGCFSAILPISMNKPSDLYFSHIPVGVCSIPKSAFMYTPLNTETLYFDGNIEYIGENAFPLMTATRQEAKVLKNFVFSNNTVVPELGQAASNIFKNQNSEFKVYVPDDLYDEWVADSNWSSISTHIVKLSEFE